jgi:hypothetical protein
MSESEFDYHGIVGTKKRNPWVAVGAFDTRLHVQYFSQYGCACARF